MTRDEAIKLLFRRASRASHPDTGGSTAAMAEVNAAYEVITGRRAETASPEEPKTAACTRPHVEEPSGFIRRMPWGKFRGESFEEVPLSYLAWIIENITNDPLVRRTAHEWLHWRTRNT